MHPHLRRLSAALALAIPLVVAATAATAAAALDASSTGLPPAQTRASSGTVRAETSSGDHDAMSDSEHAQSVGVPEHGEMSDPEPAQPVGQPEHGQMPDAEHAQSVERESAPEAGSRPRAVVLGSFGLVNAGVVVSAAVLRRGAPDRRKRRSPARAAAPTAL